MTHDGLKWPPLCITASISHQCSKAHMTHNYPNVQTYCGRGLWVGGGCCHLLGEDIVIFTTELQGHMVGSMGGVVAG